jgi:predicted 3-demethylubiquinone-9 3-methyltransferase (glyoxalase superfamily)
MPSGTGSSRRGKAQPCGWLTDRFGATWQIVPDVLGKTLGDKDPAKANRVMQAISRW